MIERKQSEPENTMTPSFLAKSELPATLEKGPLLAEQILSSKCECLPVSEGNRDAETRLESAVVMMPACGKHKH